MPLTNRCRFSGVRDGRRTMWHIAIDIQTLRKMSEKGRQALHAQTAEHGDERHEPAEDACARSAALVEFTTDGHRRRRRAGRRGSRTPKSRGFRISAGPRPSNAQRSPRHAVAGDTGEELGRVTLLGESEERARGNVEVAVGLQGQATRRERRRTAEKVKQRMQPLRKPGRVEMPKFLTAARSQRSHRAALTNRQRTARPPPKPKPCWRRRDPGRWTRRAGRCRTRRRRRRPTQSGRSYAELDGQGYARRSGESAELIAGSNAPC